MDYNCRTARIAREHGHPLTPADTGRAIPT